MAAPRGSASHPNRLPVAPLLPLFGDLDGPTAADLLGVSIAAVVRWRNGSRRTIHERDADRYAVALHRHPVEVWGDAWLALAGEAS
jgi:hypothetical protein